MYGTIPEISGIKMNMTDKILSLKSYKAEFLGSSNDLECHCLYVLSSVAVTIHVI